MADHGDIRCYDANLRPTEGDRVNVSRAYPKLMHFIGVVAHWNDELSYGDIYIETGYGDGPTLFFTEICFSDIDVLQTAKEIAKTDTLEG